MTSQKPTPVDDEQATQQAAFLTLTTQTIALQATRKHLETHQYWITKAMGAYRHVPDRYQQILGIGLAIEVLRLQQEHDLQITLTGETLSRSLLKLTCLARDAVHHVTSRVVLDALVASVLAAYVRTRPQLAGSVGTGVGDKTDVEGSHARQALYVWWLILQVVVRTGGSILRDRIDAPPVALVKTAPADGKGGHD